MSFLPDNYEKPKTGGNYFKFKNGDNRFRILSNAVIGYIYWNNENKPVRTKERPELHQMINPKLNPKTGQVEQPRHFWSFVIFDYSDTTIKIMEITQKNIQGWLNAGYEARFFQGSLENEYDYNAGGAPLYDATPDLITSTVDVSEIGPILIYDTARGIAQLIQLGNYFKGLRGI